MKLRLKRGGGPEGEKGKRGGKKKREGKRQK